MRAPKSAEAIASPDVTDRMPAEEALRASEERYRRLVDALPDVIYTIAGEQGVFLSLSRAFEQITEWPCDEWIGKSFAGLIHPDDLPLALETYREALAGRRPPLFELRIHCKSGGYRVGEFHAFPHVENGRVVGEFGIARDVTDRTHAEQALRDSELRFRAIFDHSFSLIAVVRRDGVLVDVNRAPLEITGFSREQVIGLPLWETGWWRGLPEEQEILKTAISAASRGWTARDEGTYLTVDGRKRIADRTFTPLRNAAGRISFVIVEGRDITERREAEHELRSAKERLDYLISAGPAVIYTCEPSGEYRVTFMSENCRAILGYEPAEFTGNAAFFPDNLHPDDAARTFAEVAERLPEAGQLSLEYRFRHKNGSYRWMRDEVRLIRDAKGRPVEIVGCWLDVTDRKRAEEESRGREARIKAMLESAIDAVIAIDHEGRILEFNPAAERTFGHKREAVLGRQMVDIVIPPSLRGRHREGFAHYVATGEARMLDRLVELTGLRSDGREFPAELAITRVPLEGPPLFTGYLRDITDRKRTEEALRESQQRFVSYMNSTSTLAWMKDEKFRFVYVNGALLRTFGLSMEQTLGRTDFELFPQKNARQFRANDRKVLETGEPLELVEPIPTGEGEQREWLVFKFPFTDAAGRRFVGGMGIDITERRRAEEGLRELSKRIVEAQEAERRRVSRELHDGVNQLLASARFRVQSLETRIPGRDRALWAEAMRAEAIIGDAIQEVRRISRNLRPSELDDFGLVPAIRGACAEFRRRTGVRLTLRTSRLPPRLAPEIELTLYRIAQEALNNIEKYARAKRVAVRIALAGSFIRLTIKDDGRGFSATSARGKAAAHRGLGLVNMHERAAYAGGDFALKSAPRKGTQIVVRIPIANDGPKRNHREKQ